MLTSTDERVEKVTTYEELMRIIKRMNIPRGDPIKYLEFFNLEVTEELFANVPKETVVMFSNYERENSDWLTRNYILNSRVVLNNCDFSKEQFFRVLITAQSEVTFKIWRNLLHSKLLTKTLQYLDLSQTAGFEAYLTSRAAVTSQYLLLEQLMNNAAHLTKDFRFRNTVNLPLIGLIYRSAQLNHVQRFCDMILSLGSNSKVSEMERLDGVLHVRLP